MSLENRVKKIEERMGIKKEGTLVVINTFPSGKKEGLNELPEDIEEWLTYKEQMQNPKVQPVNGIRIFIKAPIEELNARKFVQGGNPE